MSGKPRLFLHIGRHKCGTSSLQRFLGANEAVLKAHGYSYPSAYRQPYAHHPVAHAYANKVAGGDVVAFWGDVASSPRSIVSSEAFQNIDPVDLAPDLAAFDLTIIAYFREPLDYLLSSYAQKVKAGNTDATLEDYAAHFYVPYHDFMKAWREAFPQADVKVRLFERAHLAGADVRRDFLGLCGFEGTSPDDFAYSSEDGNPSIGGDLLEVVRALVPHKAAFGEGWWQLYAAVQRLAVAEARHRTRPSMPLDVQQAVRQRHREQVAGFERDFLAQGQHFAEKSFPEGAFVTEISVQGAEEIRHALLTEEPSLAPLLARFWPAVVANLR